MSRICRTFSQHAPSNHWFSCHLHYHHSKYFVRHHLLQHVSFSCWLQFDLQSHGFCHSWGPQGGHDGGHRSLCSIDLCQVFYRFWHVAISCFWSVVDLCALFYRFWHLDIPSLWRLLDLWQVFYRFWHLTFSCFWCFLICVHSFTESDKWHFPSFGGCFICEKCFTDSDTWQFLVFGAS